VALLLEQGAKKEAAGRDGKTAFMCAAEAERGGGTAARARGKCFSGTGLSPKGNDYDMQVQLGLLAPPLPASGVITMEIKQ
jgi:hypothetical protein